MATANDFGPCHHLHPGISGAQTKRVSVLIGKHQPIGTAQIKRVSGIPGSRRSNGSEE